MDEKAFLLNAFIHMAKLLLNKSVLQWIAIDYLLPTGKKKGVTHQLYIDLRVVNFHRQVEGLKVNIEEEQHNSRFPRTFVLCCSFQKTNSIW